MPATASVEQPRGNGGRFGAKAAEPARPTPLQMIHAAEHRTSFVVPPPIPIEDLNKIRRMGSRARPGEETDFNRNCERIQALKSWLTETADIGFPRDLTRAWTAWCPVHSPIKNMLRSHFDEQLERCRKRFADMVRAAEPELAAIRNRGTRSRIRASLADKVAKARDELDKALAEQARWETNFSAEEAREVAA